MIPQGQKALPRGFQRRKFLGAVGLLGAMLGFDALPALAQEDYPGRPVTIVVPYGPGGVSDAMGRLAASALNEALGQPFTVENRAGAAGTIGAAAVAHADADGYTILQHTSVMAIHTVFHRQLGFDPLADLVPVTILGSGPMVLLASNDLPASTVAELLDHVQANPGEINYASTGVGSTAHLLAELFSARNDIDIFHIPYADSGSANTAIMGGHVELMFDSISALDMIRSGSVKALAVTSAERWPELPDVPTMEEQGLDGASVDLWTALFVPADTPGEIIDRISRVIAEAAETQDYKDFAQRVGMSAIGSTPDEAAEAFAEHVRVWRELAETGFVLED